MGQPWQTAGHILRIHVFVILGLEKTISKKKLRYQDLQEDGNTIYFLTPCHKSRSTRKANQTPQNGVLRYLHESPNISRWERINHPQPQDLWKLTSVGEKAEGMVYLTNLRSGGSQNLQQVIMWVNLLTTTWNCRGCVMGMQVSTERPEKDKQSNHRWTLKTHTASSRRMPHNKQEITRNGVQIEENRNNRKGKRRAKRK